MLLSAYLLLVWIFTSAKHISIDAQLRKEFYKSAESQLTLLRLLECHRCKKNLKKIKSVEKLSALSERKKESYLGEENVKEILHDVLNGLYSMSKEKHGYHKHQL
jgi:hypothetical protein